MMGLGFVDNEQQIMKMIKEVGQHGGDEIDFESFLQLIKNSKSSDADQKTQAIRKFFTDLTNGMYGQEEISFPLLVNKMTRKKLIYALQKETDDDDPQKREGKRIMQNIKRNKQKNL